MYLVLDVCTNIHFGISLYLKCEAKYLFSTYCDMECATVVKTCSVKSVNLVLCLNYYYLIQTMKY